MAPLHDSAMSHHADSTRCCFSTIDSTIDSAVALDSTVDFSVDSAIDSAPIPSANTGCIIIEDKNGGQGKGYPNLDQTFQAEFNELLFIWIALKLNQNFMDSLESYDPIARLECPPLLIPLKIHDGGLENRSGWDWIFTGAGLNSFPMPTSGFPFALVRTLSGLRAEIPTGGGRAAGLRR